MQCTANFIHYIVSAEKNYLHYYSKYNISCFHYGYLITSQQKNQFAMGNSDKNMLLNVYSIHIRLQSENHRLKSRRCGLGQLLQGKALL